MATSERMGDGGPAFPERTEDGTCYSGATLRDYFAAKAMHALVDPMIRLAEVDAAAVFAYRIADAMLAARSQS